MWTARLPRFGIGRCGTARHRHTVGNHAGIHAMGHGCSPFSAAVVAVTSLWIAQETLQRPSCPTTYEAQLF